MNNDTTKQAAIRGKADSNYKMPFDYCKTFLDSSSTIDDPTRKVLLYVAFKPVEQAIYDGVINALPEDTSEDDYLNAAAELYFLQSRFNARIGKNKSPYGQKDGLLMYYIFCEILKRKESAFKGYKEDGGSETGWGAVRKSLREKFENDAFERFLSMYPSLDDNYFQSESPVINALNRLCRDKKLISSDEVMSIINNHNYASADVTCGFEKGYYAYMYEYATMRGWAKGPKPIYEKGYGKDRAYDFDRVSPSLKELYMFGICCGLKREQFDTLFHSLLKTEGIDERRYICRPQYKKVCDELLLIFDNIMDWIDYPEKLAVDLASKKGEKKPYKEYIPSFLFNDVYNHVKDKMGVDLYKIRNF